MSDTDILSSRYKLEKSKFFCQCSALRQGESKALKTRVPKFETRITQPYPPKMHCVEAYRMEHPRGYRTFGTNNAISSYMCGTYAFFYAVVETQSNFRFINQTGKGNVPAQLAISFFKSLISCTSPPATLALKSLSLFASFGSLD